MSGGGPPHHPHNRHGPPANSAWNHLHVPGYFPRQPQVAHMSGEHPLLHQASWHTPTTTDAMKMIPHTQMLNDMFKNEALFPRDCVDLSLTRNAKKPFLGNQNGEHASTPAAISLSVRDASKINSLPPGMLDIQAMELTKCASPNLKSAISPGSIRASSISPGVKDSLKRAVSPGSIQATSASTGLKSSSPSLLIAASKSLSPGRKSLSPGPVSSPGLSLALGLGAAPPCEINKNQKRSNIRVDSILERLNPVLEKTFPPQDGKQELPAAAGSAPGSLGGEKLPVEKPTPAHGQSVIVQAVSSFDENSNSSGTTNAPTPKEEDSASMHSNEDSLDSTKSRRKRKPSKTVRVNKEDEVRSDEAKTAEDVTVKAAIDITANSTDPASIATILEGAPSKIAEEKTLEPKDEVDSPPSKTRRKSAAETIDDIAAMVQEGLKKKTKEESKHESGSSGLASDVTGDSLEATDSTESNGEVKSDFESAQSLTGEEPNGESDSRSESGKTESQKGADDHSVEVESTVTEMDTTPSDSTDTKLASSEEDKTEVDNTDTKSVSLDIVDGMDVADHPSPSDARIKPSTVAKPVTVSVIKTKEVLDSSLTATNAVSTQPSPPPAVLPVTPIITAAQKKATITQFVEVENKLEEMFAGIVEDHADTEPSREAPVPTKIDSGLDLMDDSFLKLEDSTGDSNGSKSVSQPLGLPAVSDIKSEEGGEKKPLPKKVAPRRNRPSSKSDQDGEVPVKKKKLTKTKNSGTNLKKPPRSPLSHKSPKKFLPVTSSKPTKSLCSDIVKDIYSYDSGSNASSSRSRGPFVQIRGPRDSPLSVSVVNAPLGGDEDGEKRSIKNKKFHDDSEYRHKVRSKGLHCSTLSNKYDAERKDASWICAFCKRGPHASELTGPSVISDVPPQGDLFGPYFITANCPEFEKRLDDPYDRQFKSRKITKVLDAAACASKSNKKTKRKSESSLDPTDCYLGITDTGSGTYEVWSHEDCMVWSTGVYLIGPKIAGLEEAVWNCSNITCLGCGLKGANITCVKRGCLNSAHVCCARKAGWLLDEASFKAYCVEHAP